MPPTRRRVLHTMAGGLSISLAGCTARLPKQLNPDDTNSERFFIENRASRSHTVEVKVTQGEEQLIEGRYTAPAGTGLRFEKVFPWGQYQVRARVDSGRWREKVWTPDSCADTPAEDGNMNAGVIVKDDGFHIGWNECDLVILGDGYHVSRVEPASDYRE